MKNIKRWFENDSIYTGTDYSIREWDGHLEAKTDTAIFLVVSPHSGTNDNWMLRASTIAAFDRWANSRAIELYFESDTELCAYLTWNMLRIYKTLLSYLSKEYDEMEKLYEENTEADHC